MMRALIKGELKVAGSVSVGNSGAIDYLHGQVSCNAFITPRTASLPQSFGFLSAQFLNACTIAPEETCSVMHIDTPLSGTRFLFASTKLPFTSRTPDTPKIMPKQ
jgi:hypothetical protein